MKEILRECYTCIYRERRNNKNIDNTKIKLEKKQGQLFIQVAKQQQNFKVHNFYRYSK